MEYESLVFNLGGTGQVRRETLEGREHLVVPTVIQTVGVHNGSQGPLLYSEPELSKSAHILNWNHKPIVLYHPMMNGSPVSGCDPQILNSRKMGVVLNSVFEGKAKSESWIDVDKTMELAPEVVRAIEAGQPVRVSSGIYLTKKGPAGVWNGTSYTGVATDIIPDHLAILPDKPGADRGAGLLMNAAPETVPEKVKKANDALQRKIGGSNYVEDVYDGYMVYCNLDGVFKVNYQTQDDRMELVGNPVQVERVVFYRSKADGSPVGNSSGWEFSRNGGFLMSAKFDRKAHLDSLVGNGGGFEEKDREWLDKLTDDQLAKLKPASSLVAKPTPVGNDQTPVQSGTTVIVQQPTPVGNDQKPVTPTPTPTPTDLNTWLSQQPPEIRAIVGNALDTQNALKKQLVDNLMKVPNNPFTEAHLMTKDIKELQGLTVLAANGQPHDANPPMFQNGFNFGGLAPVMPFVGNAGGGAVEEPLPPTPSSFVKK